MKCKDMRKLLSAYADGELGPNELRLVEEHLDGCETCQEVLAEYQMMTQFISRLGTVRLQRDITDETMERIRSANTKRWKPTAWQMASVGALLIALIVGLVVGMSMTGGKTDFALAAEKIVRNSEAFKMATAGEGRITLEEVAEEGDAEATLTFSTENGKRIVADVDLKNERVMELRTFGITVTFPPNPETDLELSHAEREEAMEVAVSAPAVQEFLVNGWEVTHVLGHLYDGRRVADVGIIPNHDFLGVITTDGYYMIDGKSVRIDLDKREVLSVSEFGIVMDASAAPLE